MKILTAAFALSSVLSAVSMGSIPTVASADTVETYVALHKAVMQKLAENGGKVPDSLKA